LAGNNGNHKERGEIIYKRGAAAPLKHPHLRGYFVKGLKGTEVPLRNSLPSPLQGESKRGEASLTN